MYFSCLISVATFSPTVGFFLLFFCKPLCSAGRCGSWARSWVGAGTRSPSASHIASQISPRETSFLERWGDDAFDKTIVDGDHAHDHHPDHHHTHGHHLHGDHQLWSIICMANINMLKARLAGTSTVVAATACFSSSYSIRQISACSTTENLCKTWIKLNQTILYQT